MNFKKISAIAMVVGIGMGAGVAIPALADGRDLTPDGNVGLYQDAWYNGLMGYRWAGLGVMNISGGNNDDMSSWVNKTGSAARWYQHRDGNRYESGFCRTMWAHSANGWVGGFENDQLTSWATNGGC